MQPDVGVIALAAIANHERRYGVRAPERLLAFYRDDCRPYHLMWTRQAVPGFGGDLFQLGLTSPTWLDKDDDAVNGPDGEWAAARYHLPIFCTDQSLYVVADLRTTDCQVGWYQEETHDADFEDYRDGVLRTDQSLTAFLAGLLSSVEDETGAFRPVGGPDWDEDFDDDGPRVFDVVRPDS